MVIKKYIDVLKRHDKIKEIITIIGIFIIVLPIFLYKLDKEIFAVDESLHISRGIKGVNLIIHGIIGGNEWRYYITNEGEVKYGAIGPPHIIMGIGPWLIGVKSGGWNVGIKPPNHVLASARAMVAALGAATCVVIYYLGRELNGFRTGLTASLILAFNPLWLLNSRLNLRDAPSAFFSTLSILLLTRTHERKKFTSKLTFITLSGVTTGLAIASKEFAGVVFLTIIIFLLMIFIINEYRIIRTKRLSKNGRQILICLFIYITFSILFFIVSLPSLWKDPTYMLQRTQAKLQFGMSEYKERIVIGHTFNFDVPNDFLAALTGILNLVIWPLYKPTSLGHFPTCMTWFGNFLQCHNTVPALFFFFVGITYLTLRGSKIKLSRFETLVMMWFLVTLVGLSLWIPIFWHRYVLQLISPIVLIETIGLEYILQNMSQRIKYFLTGLTLITHAGFTIAGLPETRRYSLQVILMKNIGLMLSILFILLIFFIIILQIKSTRKNE